MAQEDMERQQAERERRIRAQRAAIRAEREARRRKKQRQSLILFVAFLVILLLAVVLILKGCGKKKTPAPDSSSEQTSTEASVQEESTEPESEASESVEASDSESSESSEESPESSESSEEESSEDPNVGALTTWDLETLDTTEYNFGYAPSNRDERNFPTDWTFYESNWGEFNVDWVQDPDQNIIYLTMDEGFPNEYTTTILDILEEKDVKATFFLTKMFLDGGEQSMKQIQRMLDDGHTLGNHTCTHPAMPGLSVEQQTQEIMGVHNIILDTFNYDMKLFRFPQGKYSAQSLGLVDNLGYKTVFWSYAYNDYSETQPPVQESYEAAVNMLHPGAIYLLHANSSTNTAFLADWIDAAREAGFEFGVYPLARN